MDTIALFQQGLITKTPEEAEARAQELAKVIPENHTLALWGDLGSGKTTFVKGLAKAWKIKEPITSPTYNLFTLYHGTRHLLHLDAYRLASEGEIESLCLEDVIRTPYCLVIEWPGNVQSLIPEDAWHLEFSINAGENHHFLKLKKF